MEILFSIFAAIFGILAGVFGVRNRIKNSGIGTRGGIRNDRSRYNDLVSDHKRLKKYEARDDEDIRKCNDILKRIRKREQEVGNKE